MVAEPEKRGQEVTEQHDSDQAGGQLHKDEVLDKLSDQANVAQFVSFAPGPDLPERFCHIRDYAANHRFQSVKAAVTALLKANPDRAVNIRSYRPEQPKGGEFLYGLMDVEVVLGHLRRLAAEGSHTIVNETVDVMDGGVSGVAVGDLIEFAPQDTPRCVEKPGACRFPREIGVEVLGHVYGFRPFLDFPPDLRVEFSLHPLRRGVRHEHTIIWEIEHVGEIHAQVDVSWPNRFSTLLGDKAFGLLTADSFGLRVPKTTVIGRHLAPFTFGRSTGTGEPWIRTCPIIQEPGKFTTRRGWIDPFQLLSDEDAQEPYRVASVLTQEGVEPVYSGALIASEQADTLIEGVSGSGAEFMLGKRGPEILPAIVHDAVMEVYRQAQHRLGPVRMEWVFDGSEAWVVQLHKGSVSSTGHTIVPGQPLTFHEFDVGLGLEALRQLVPRIQKSGDGVLLLGDVGITSHFGDLLRRAGVPSRLVRRGRMPDKT
jgi:hypothetical protein